MPVKKLSVALDESVASAAQRSAERSGLSLSAWLNRAASHALTVEEGLRAVAEWEREHGAFTEQELRQADHFLDSVAKRPRRARRAG